MSVEASPKSANRTSVSTSPSTSSIPVVELNEAALDELIGRIGEAREHNLALSSDDYDVLLNALLTLVNMQERLSHDDLTIHKLRKLMGLVRSSEKLKDLLPDEDEEADGGGDDADNGARSDGAPGRSSGKGNKQPRKRKPRAAPMKPDVHHHAHGEMNKGDRCPGCHAGKVYKHSPAQLLRIVGHAPFSAQRHVCEQLRCNGCGEVFTAERPDAVRADGRVDQQYGYSARTVMAIMKYFAGSPFYRQESLQRLLGGHLPASTIFDQCEHVANALNPVFLAMIRIAADAPLFYVDDTTHRILRQQPLMKSRGGKQRLRSGVYTSACLAIERETARRLVLFQTNVGHAGEWIEEILGARDATLDAPIVMSDALSANHVADITVNKALCNAHGRRGFAELALQSPVEARIALKHYEHVWMNESHCTEHGLDAAERQAWHHEHSLPHLAAIKSWCEEELDSERVESNSNLGKAMQYFVRHYEGLSAFCHTLGAPVDNNEIERLIKLIVRHRKNSLFYQTPAGAAIGDVITSILATCYESDVNAFDYLNAVQRNPLAVKAAPEKWLPWNYPGDP